MAIDAAAAGQLRPESVAAEDTVAAPRPRRSISAQGWATVFGVVALVGLATLTSWLGFRVHQSQQAQSQRAQFLQVARQGALNLTTIDWHHAEADVHRVLDGATGEFYNDFARRSGPFIEVLQQAKASTVGTVTEAGLESQTADSAQALVEVSVQTSNAGEPEPVPRIWRMRIAVARIGDHLKVSHVGFVA
ncbi:mammalian cell entry protein [Mycobacterium camsae]|uniref:mammalian cell entry protein n=1 Tax=Mycobacterium gordonae TaxID=1778 RepID=UPI001F11B7F4|nr:mammalian cell entry protein [Mycobacterium gordonae]